MIARIARVLLAMTGAAGVLCGGAWLGGAFAPAAQAAQGRTPRATDDLAYARDGEIPVGDALAVNGQPMQLSVFYTADAPEQVAAFYADAFRARGQIPLASSEGALAHVSAFDPQDGMQRFINAVRQPGGQTLVMVGITNPRRPPRIMDAAKSASFPVPDEQRGFLGYRSEDAGQKAESAQFLTAQTPAQVTEFYRKALSAQGWTERKADGSDSMVLFEKSGETLSVAVQALEEKKGAAVFVNRLQGGVK